MLEPASPRPAHFLACFLLLMQDDTVANIPGADRNQSAEGVGLAKRRRGILCDEDAQPACSPILVSELEGVSGEGVTWHTSMDTERRGVRKTSLVRVERPAPCRCVELLAMRSTRANGNCF